MIQYSIYNFSVFKKILILKPKIKKKQNPLIIAYYDPKKKSR